MYQALYRKWRPKTFDEVVGQPHVTETLKKQLVTDRLSHAYLFIGSRGTGKTSCAKILAKAVNCESPVGGNPCNECPSCTGIDSGSILDVVELDAASNNGVDNVRALRDEAVYTPAAVKKRVYIIDEVHMLSVSAFNALLKILEEPPAHLMFILATTENHKIPATILSRCQRYSFRRVPFEDIVSRIDTVTAAESIDITEDARALLARLSDGSMRDALSLLDQCAYSSPIDTELVLSVAGLSGTVKTAALYKAVCALDAATALEELDTIYQSGRDVGSLLGEIASLVRDLLIRKIAPQKAESLLSGIYDSQTLESFSRVSPDTLMRHLDLLNTASVDISKSTSRKLTAEMCIIELCTPPLMEASSSHLTKPASIFEAAPAPQTNPQAPPEAVKPAEEPETGISPDIAQDHMESADPQEENMNATSKDAVLRDAIWPGILEKIKDSIDLAVYSVLTDSTQVSCICKGETLNLSFGNDFTKGISTTAEVLDEIRKAACQVSGRNIVVKVTDDFPTSEVKESKLDKLSKFDNITFK